jgi:hypothetical protein
LFLTRSLGGATETILEFSLSQHTKSLQKKSGDVITIIIEV